MLEIKADELYDRLVSYGMFSEKLPHIFTGDLFLNYCKNICKQTFSDKWRGYINYESMRNTNISRNIGIPTPMGHELLCKTLMKHWNKLTEYFGAKTKEQSRIISRIHIRKMQEGEDLLCLCTEVLFFLCENADKRRKGAVYFLCIVYITPALLQQIHNMLITLIFFNVETLYYAICIIQCMGRNFNIHRDFIINIIQGVSR